MYCHIKGNENAAHPKKLHDESSTLRKKSMTNTKNGAIRATLVGL
jgi:hypothetical protein